MPSEETAWWAPLTLGPSSPINWASKASTVKPSVAKVMISLQTSPCCFNGEMDPWALELGWEVVETEKEDPLFMRSSWWINCRLSACMYVYMERSIWCSHLMIDRAEEPACLLGTAMHVRPMGPGVMTCAALAAPHHDNGHTCIIQVHRGAKQRPSRVLYARVYIFRQAFIPRAVV